MAALGAVVRLAAAGQHIIAGDDLYGGTSRLLQRVAPGLGLDVSNVDMSDPRCACPRSASCSVCGGSWLLLCQQKLSRHTVLHTHSCAAAGSGCGNGNNPSGTDPVTDFTVPAGMWRRRCSRGARRWSWWSRPPTRACRCATSRRWPPSRTTRAPSAASTTGGLLHPIIMLCNEWFCITTQLNTASHHAAQTAPCYALPADSLWLGAHAHQCEAVLEVFVTLKRVKQTVRCLRAAS